MKTINTPWGMSQTHKEYSPGVECFSTSSHGGFHITGQAAQRMERETPELWRQATPALGWFEEDCAGSAVVLAFPELFDGCAIGHAIKSAKRWFCKQDRNFDAIPGTDEIPHYWESDVFKAAQAKADAWQTENAELFEQGTFSTDGKTVDIYGDRVKDKMRIKCTFQSGDAWTKLPRLFTIDQAEKLGAWVEELK